MPFPDLRRTGDQVLGERSVPGGSCVLITSLGPTAQFPGCAVGALYQVCRSLLWRAGGIATKKASGGDGIPVELFQILRDDAVKMLHSICQQTWITQQWPQDWQR